MSKHDAIFEEHYTYSKKLSNALIDKLDLSWVDCYDKYQIHPVRNGRGYLYEVTDLDDYPRYQTFTFKSKKKAMQFVVEQLFNKLYDYEQYKLTRDSGLPF